MINSTEMLNSTVTMSKVGQCSGDSEMAGIFKALTYGIIIVVSLIGNIAVITAACKDRTMNPTITLYITNICAADVIITLVYLPRMAVRYALRSTRWVIGGTLGSILCKLVPSIYHVSVTASILTLLALAIDRFLAVFYPLKRRFTVSKTRHGKIVVIMIWVTAFLARSPYLSVTTLRPKPNDNFICSASFSNLFDNYLLIRNIYYTLLLVAFYLIPLVLTCFLYLAIIIHLRMRQEIFTSQPRIFNFRKASKKTVFTFLAVSVSFSLCWGLYFFGQVVYTSVPCEIRFWRTFLANMNCAISPWVFLALNPHHRRLLKPSKVMLTGMYSL
ncbi:QRFP-like peptide receptor [Actinia tenebrosa]|uniref:QRFP-like peptide receptor n=1 Tax=Actinia tenebrosa TaxID=6105 RepID=A0A6P8HVK5_ACTTE|nr:QRFP-like peptide receptor [Actinia tenebrosa]